MWVSACQKRYSGSSTGRFLKVVCTNIPDWEPRLILQRAESIKWAETVYIFEPKDSIFSLWRVSRSVVSDSVISWTVAHQSSPLYLSDSSVHGILQARMLEWVAVPFSRASSRPSESPGLRADSLPTEPSRKPSPFLRGWGVDLIEEHLSSI